MRRPANRRSELERLLDLTVLGLTHPELTRRVDVGRLADTSGPEQVEDVTGADRARADAEGVGRQRR
jgi:hypothetical protein